MALDPLDLLTNAGGSLVRRILSFFAYGWMGLFLGRLASAFQQWEDFLTPWKAFTGLLQGPEEIFYFTLWPAAVVLGLAKTPWLLIGFLILLACAFLAIVYSDEPSPLWALSLIGALSILPLVGDPWVLPPWVVLAFEWLGLGSLGWWLYQRHHGPLEPPFVPLPDDEDAEEEAPGEDEGTAPPASRL